MPPEKETFELYGGKVRLEYTDKSHRYRASVEGGKLEHCPSVTTILNVLAKPALVEWAVKCACNYVDNNLKELVAGDSFSVSDVFKIIEKARTAHDVVREEAAEIGTNVHDWLAGYWHEVMFNGSSSQTYLPQEEKASKCVQAAFNWFNEHDLKPVSVEEPQYSLIHKFCGRPDWIGCIDGQLSVLDYKSTKQIYPELCLQETAYAKMHEEMTGNLPATRWGLRLDKESGQFEARCYKPDTFERDWKTFEACFLLYDTMKHLRRKPKEEKTDFLAEL